MQWAVNACAPQASKVTIGDADGDVSVYGGWGFTIVGILCIAYAVAVLHTVVFGLMTWMKRLEAPAPTHGLGPRAAAVRSSLPPRFRSLSGGPAGSCCSSSLCGPLEYLLV